MADDELISRPKEGDDCREFIPIVTRGTRLLFGSDYSASFRAQLRQLNVEVLIRGADASVSDACHSVTCAC